jgi:hypothetical protein
MKKSIQKISSIVTVLAILLSLFVPVSAKDIEIKDMKPTDEGYTEVQWVINQGWMSLTTGKFFPNSYVRRNEFAMILCKVTGDIKNLKNPTKPTFLDVPKTDKYYRYIETAKPNMTYFKTSKGLYFKPNTYLTREDAVMSIVKVMGYNTDEALASGADSEMSLDDLIDDSDKVAPALVKYVSIAIQNELIDLREADGKTYFDPKKSITRKQLAMLLYNACQKKDYSKGEEEIGDGVIDESSNQSNSNSTNKQNQSPSNTTTNNSTNSKVANNVTTSTISKNWKPLSLDNVEVTTFAGDGWAELKDGDVNSASFYLPISICADDEGNYYVADGIAISTVRKITRNNEVITVLKPDKEGSPYFKGMLLHIREINFDDRRKKIYITDETKILETDEEFREIKRLASTGGYDRFDGRVVSDGYALYYIFYGHDTGYNDNYCKYILRNVINNNRSEEVQISSGGSIPGILLETGKIISSILYNKNDNCLYFVEDNKIFKMSLYREKNVELIAGKDLKSNELVTNYTDGKATEVRFSSITDILIDPTGNIFVADNGSKTLRMITPDGYVKTIAGTTGQSGYKDGAGNQALFGSLNSMCFTLDGNILVADAENHVIRKVIIRR